MGNVFSARNADFPNDRAETTLAFVQPAPPDLRWNIRLDEFEELLASKRESASGPDGLPNSVNRSGGGIGAKILFAAYQACLQGAALPAGFGVSRTVYISKSTEVDAQGRIRSPETLRLLTSCNCDRKVITAAMCFGLRRYSIECIHNSQRCVTQRIMTDNIFEIETAAVALRARYSDDPGILLTDFSCAYPSVDRRWIFQVLERAGVPLVLRLFLRGIYDDSITSVEHAGVARGQFANMRGVRQSCPASGYLFTMAFDSVYRWLLSAVLPPEPHRPWFLQRCACAYADDFALAKASLRESLPMVADAFTTIDTVTGMSNHKKCHWVQFGNLAIPQRSEWVGTHVPVFRQMQIKDHAQYLGVEIGPGAADRRWNKERNRCVGVCARIRASSHSLVQRLVSFQDICLSILSSDLSLNLTQQL